LTADEYAVVPLTGVRGAIAGRMMSSLQTSAQLTFHLECDASGLLERRRGQADSPRVGVEDLLIHALARTLKRHPALNGAVVDREIRLYHPIRVAVAVALDVGLMAPALPDVREASVSQIAGWRADLVARARSGQLKPAEMSRGTITMTNLGHRGIHYFTPVLNAPQIAILGLGAIRPMPAVDNAGALVARPVLPLSLTVDHRAVDGDPAGHFLSSLRAEIENGPG
jgi:pyruvate dehydrogenase E2 component (dihydrolipoamide acetyltransferase)